MFARFVIFVFIAALALPVFTLTRPAETRQSPWIVATVAAKSKKHKGHKHKPHKKPQHHQQAPLTPGTHIVRQTVTRTFSSTQPINVPGGAPGVTQGPGIPYPSAIDVSGLTNGTITDVNLTIDILSHSYVEDVDVLLSSGVRRALVMSDVGSSHQVENLPLTLDDEAATTLPDGVLNTGSYRPANLVAGDASPVDLFAAPAPTPDGSVALSTFDGANPNGTWQLWINDDAQGDYGAIGGWSLQITAEIDVEVSDVATASAGTTRERRKH